MALGRGHASESQQSSDQGEGYLPVLGLEIYFLADDDDGNLAGAAEVDNLVIDGGDHLERLPRVDGVDKEVTVNTVGVLGREERVLVLDVSI